MVGTITDIRPAAIILDNKRYHYGQLAPSAREIIDKVFAKEHAKRFAHDGNDENLPSRLNTSKRNIAEMLAKARIPKVGEQITLEKEDGKTISGIITEVGPSVITIDNKKYHYWELTPSSRKTIDTIYLKDIESFSLTQQIRTVTKLLIGFVLILSFFGLIYFSNKRIKQFNELRENEERERLEKEMLNRQKEMLNRQKEMLNRQKEIKKLFNELKISDDRVLLANFVKKYNKIERCPEDELDLLKELLLSKGYNILPDQLVDLLDLQIEEAFHEALSEYLEEKMPKSLESLASVIIDSPINNYEHVIEKIERFLAENQKSFSFVFDKEKFLKHIELKLKQKQLNDFEKSIRKGVFYSIEEIDYMSGSEFELFLEKLFKRMGYEVTVTPSSGDQGADLLINKNGISTVVQAKRYSGKVGNKAVQEVVAARGFYGARKAMVVTNSEFTPAAYSLAEKNDVELVNRSILDDLVGSSF